MRVVKDLQSSKHDTTVQKTLFALNEFVGNLDYDIKLYLDDVITLLMGYINATHFSRDVKYWALVSLSSTIGVAQKRIIQYTDGLMTTLTAIINAQGSIAELQNVKGQALMCIGKLAASCTKEHWKHDLNEFT